VFGVAPPPETVIDRCSVRPLEGLATIVPNADAGVAGTTSNPLTTRATTTADEADNADHLLR
jgi:hypothetical protein